MNNNKINKIYISNKNKILAKVLKKLDINSSYYSNQMIYSLE